MSFRGVKLQKVIVLVNNKSDFKYKQASNLKDYQVEYLDINPNELKTGFRKLRTDILILNRDYLGSSFNLLAQLVLQSEMLVVYISKTLEFGQLYNIMEEPNFVLVNEDNILALPDLVRFAIKNYHQLLALKKKINRLEDDIKTNDLVREAKLKLMKDKKMTENEAYKYIINLAMQRRIKKSELAKLIIGGLIL